MKTLDLIKMLTPYAENPYSDVVFVSEEEGVGYFDAVVYYKDGKIVISMSL